eukprot:1807512-Pyramimonas_sp.AAC.1
MTFRGLLNTSSHWYCHGRHRAEQVLGTPQDLPGPAADHAIENLLHLALVDAQVRHHRVVPAQLRRNILL